MQKTLVHEMLGRGPWGLASFISVHTGIGCVGIVRFGSKAQKDQYLPKMAKGEWLGSFALTEPGAGSDAGALQTRAERRGDHYVLNGRKTFITNAPLAHQYLLFARTDKGITAFIVDRESPGLSIGSIFDTLGHQGSRISEIVLEDCRIPATALIGEEGKGFDYAKRTLAEGRTTLAARCVGAGQKALELALQYAEERHTFGKPLAEHQSIAFRLAQMSARTEAARLLVYRSAWLLDQRRPGHPRVVDRQAGRRGERLADGRRRHADLRRQRLHPRRVHDRPHLARRARRARLRRLERGAADRHRAAAAQGRRGDEVRGMRAWGLGAWGISAESLPSLLQAALSWPKPPQPSFPQPLIPRRPASRVAAAARRSASCRCPLQAMIPGSSVFALVEAQRLAVAVGDAAAGFGDQRGAGADVPLVLRRQAEGGVAAPGGDQRQLVGDAAGELDAAAPLELVPLAALVLRAAGEHARRRQVVAACSTRAGAPLSVYAGAALRRRTARRVTGL